MSCTRFASTAQSACSLFHASCDKNLRKTFSNPFDDNRVKHELNEAALKGKHVAIKARRLKLIESIYVEQSYELAIRDMKQTIRIIIAIRNWEVNKRSGISIQPSSSLHNKIRSEREFASTPATIKRDNLRHKGLR